MHADLKKVENELANVGGRLEWSTDQGVGISFKVVEADDVFRRIPATLNAAAWINLEGTGISDSVLAQLEGSPLLESIRLVGTQVTAAGVEQFLMSTPSLQEIVLSDGQFERKELNHIRVKWPKLRVVEVK